jgi:hypothetical protein
MPEPIIESVEALPSEDNGNVPVDAPSVEPKPADPAEPKEEPATPAEPVAELFELPDGRKVDASTLTKEWKENFLPDYTRKSQDLARVKETINPSLPAKPTNPLEDPNWQPASYAELVQIAKQEMKADLERETQAQIEARQAIENQVSGQLDEIKKTDPTLNENALFLHATKYNFRDLKVAHQNMKDMAELAKNVQQNTAKNIAKRNDPVSISPGASGARPDPSQFSTAREYLRSLTN